MSEHWRSGSEGSNQNAKVRVARLASRQRGRVSWAQLERLGIGKATIAKWVRDGYLQRVLPGVYAVGHRAPAIDGDLAAALLYAGPGAVLSHETALWWLALIDAQPHTIHVSTPRRRRSLAGMQVHDRRSLLVSEQAAAGTVLRAAPAEVDVSGSRTWHRGLPVSPVALALRDYAESAPLARVRRVLAQAEYHRRLDAQAAYAVLGRGRPGSATLRQALEHNQPRLAHTRSVLEERFLGLCEASSLPIPQCNATIAGLMVDMLWRAQRVIVELDGQAAHGTWSQIERDRSRELTLRTAGFVVLRYTWRQITTEPEFVVADLTAALGRASAGAWRDARATG